MDLTYCFDHEDGGRTGSFVRSLLDGSFHHFDEFGNSFLTQDVNPYDREV